MRIEEKIEQLVTDSISSYLNGNLVYSTQVLDYIFPKERRIRAIIGGLETSLGTKLWEQLAKLLASENGFEVLDEKIFNTNVPKLPKKLNHFISDFKERKDLDPTLSHDEYHVDLINFINNNNFSDIEYQKKIKKGQGVDVWLRKNGIEYLIDIKTVQLNAGAGDKCNSNMLHWYAYNILRKSKSKTKSLTAFPYNPHLPKDYWRVEKGKISPLIPGNEALVADEFWDFISGQTETTNLIYDVFKKLGSDNFADQFKHIFNSKN
jgi:hypothetical protein